MISIHIAVKKRRQHYISHKKYIEYHNDDCSYIYLYVYCIYYIILSHMSRTQKYIELCAYFVGKYNIDNNDNNNSYGNK